MEKTWIGPRSNAYSTHHLQCRVVENSKQPCRSPLREPPKCRGGASPRRFGETVIVFVTCFDAAGYDENPPWRKPSRTVVPVPLILFHVSLARRTAWEQNTATEKSKSFIEIYIARYTSIISVILGPLHLDGMLELCSKTKTLVFSMHAPVCAENNHVKQ